MKGKALFILIVLFLLSCGLSGCGLFSPEPSMSPQEVVNEFYHWYIGYPGNPLVDKEYRNSPYLAESFIEHVDGTVASFELGSADPILLAQDIPERFTVGEAVISDGHAEVPVEFYWGGNPTPSERRVELEMIDGEWKITAVHMVD